MVVRGLASEATFGLCRERAERSGECGGMTSLACRAGACAPVIPVAVRVVQPATRLRNNLYANLYALNNDVRRCLPTRLSVTAATAAER
jgi:hypothetical protein